MNGYTLIREWYNYKFEHPSTVKAIHSDFYCFLVDRWNRLGQKEEFGLPTVVTMELLGIGSYNTYKKTLYDLVTFGFVKIVSESKNQYQSRVVALSKIDEATDKALDKAHDKASDEAPDKAPDTIIEQQNNKTTKQQNKYPSLEEFLTYGKEKKPLVCVKALTLKFHAWSENDWHKESNGKRVKINNWKTTLLNTLPYIQEAEPEQPKFQRLY